MIATLAAGNFAIGMGAFVVIGVLSPLAADLGLSKTGAGLIMTIYAVAYAVLSPLLVAASGRLGRRTVLAVGLAVFALASLLAVVAWNGPALYAARILAAVGGGLFTPVAASVAFSASAPEARGRALARVFLGMTLSQALGIPLGSFVGYTFGWRAAFAIVLVLSVATLVLVLRTVPRRVAFQPNSLRTLVEALADWRSLMSILVTATIISAPYFVYTFITPLLEARMGFGRDGVALVLLAYGAGAVAGSWAAGIWTDRFGPLGTIYGVLAVQVVLMPVFSFLPVPLPVLLLVTFLWAMFGWSFLVPQQTRLMRQAPQRQAVVLSLNAACIYIGASLGSAIGGVVAENFGLDWLGIAGMLAVLLATVHLFISESLFRNRRAV
ncbi:MFS transporter [Aquibium sp. ELW1220]|uniref:MFS transporter n=1 Tax=Aquibium sp. ELW1220 TaxID=2976766 RepID=UPI0025B05A77|nr:MFS transporter [Aquibium sp. ELW1220]MDN2578609.1 MFS transporter [Aquibium sp. ELW1220]